MDGDGASELLLEPWSADYKEGVGSLAPDGAWRAYTSDETGMWEVYVVSYPELEHRMRISSSGGEEARWSPGGDEIIYRWNSRWFVADVSFDPEPAVGRPRLLFEGPYVNVNGYSWDISADGQRFLVIEGIEQMKILNELAVITNFDDLLRRRLP